MTLIYELDLTTLKMYMQTKIELLRSGLSKVRDRQTDARDRKHYHAAVTDW